MPEYQIRNVSVSFPYEAYPVQVRFRDPSTIEWGFWQLTYMEHVLQAIQEVCFERFECKTKKCFRKNMRFWNHPQEREKRFVCYARHLLGANPK